MIATCLWMVSRPKGFGAGLEWSQPISRETKLSKIIYINVDKYFLFAMPDVAMVFLAFVSTFVAALAVRAMICLNFEFCNTENQLRELYIMATMLR